MGTGGALTRWVLLAAGSAAAGGEAFAGAWTQPQGKSQTINSVSRETGDFGETWRSDSFGEFGLAGGWGGRLRLESQVRLDDGEGERLSVEAGLQKSFRLGDRSSVSVSASWLSGDSLLGPTCSGSGYEARTAYGRSFAVDDKRSVFVNVETAFKSRGPRCGRIANEVAVGADLGWNFRAIGKVMNEQGDGAKSVKAEAVLLYDMDNKYTVGMGYRRELSDAFKEEGFVVSVWQRF